MGNFVSYANSQELMQAIANKFKELNGAYIFKGSSTFANLPSSITKQMVGYTYNMSNDFTTDARFIEGAGKKYSAGTNVSITDQSTYSTVTPVGTENPSEEGWYELDGTDYVLSEDTEVDSGKTYYEFVANFMFDTVANFIDVDEILDNIQAVSDMISGEFDGTLAYSKGDIVVYNSKLYKFNTDHAIGAWNASEVDNITVAELIASAEPDSLTPAQITSLLALLD